MSSTQAPAAASGAVHRLVLRWGFVRTWLLGSALLVSLFLGVQALVSTLLGQPLSPLLAAQVVLGALVLAPLASWLLWRVAQVEQARADLAAREAAATTDDGVPARGQFQRLAEREFARSRRYGEDAAVLLIAADHFKPIAVAHGAKAADAVLTAIALKARASLRQPDLVARYGNEELVVLLPNTDPLGALDVAERIREAAAAIRLRRPGLEVASTVSIGVASLGVGHDALDVLVHDADVALLAAKQAGRNCVRAAPIQPRPSEHSSLESPPSR